VPEKGRKSEWKQCDSVLFVLRGGRDGIGDPGKVVCGAGCDGESEDFGDVVGMEAPYLGF